MPSKLVRRYGKKKHKRKNPDEGSSSSSKNPTAIAEVGEFILPGFAGFAVSRFATRIASEQIHKRKPSWGRHAGAAAAAAAFLSAWLLAHRVKALRQYHLPIIVGAGIAAVQTLLQLYVPRLGWMVSAPELEDTSLDQLDVASAASDLPEGFTAIDDDPAQYVYNDSFDPGRMDASQHQTDDSAAQSSTDDDDVDLDEQHMGGF